MKFTYEALWKKLEEKNLSLENVAESIGVPIESFDPIKENTPAPRDLIEKICAFLGCEIQDIVDKASITAKIYCIKKLTLEQDAAITRGVRSKLHSRADEENRYSVVDVSPEEYDFVLEGIFFLEDFDIISGCIAEALQEVDADIDIHSVNVKLGSRDEVPPTLSEEEKARREEAAKEAASIVSKLPKKPPQSDKAEKPAAGEGATGVAQNLADKLTKSKEGKDAAPEIFDDKAEEVQTQTENKSEEPPKSYSILKEVDSLVSANEFRDLCKEIFAVAKQFKSKETQEIFFAQSYLFSIGNGGGLSTSLNLLGKVVNESGIVPVSDSPREYDLPYDSNPDNVKKTLAELYRSIAEALYGKNDVYGKIAGLRSMKILCLDISEWIDHLSNYMFRDFLRTISTLQSDAIVVFRIPYVEKDVFLKVRDALNDMLCVRMITFKPLSAQDYRKVVKIELAKYGYQMDPTAWKYIEKRLTDEKSDGTFYGIKTAKKVIHELLYKKAVTNSSLKKPSHTITAKDARALTAFAVEDTRSAEEMLDSLVGMDDVKRQINEILNQIEFSRSTKGMATPTIHMRFVGNPGTGKTTVARILGKILKEKGILRVGNFFEYTGRDFCGRYVGETTPKTQMMCRDAYGSVLFIDEAYSLYKGDSNERDYGTEALDALISEMENHRDDLLVIMAGYPDEMDRLMEGNAGLRSRIPYRIVFRNFTREELYSIFESLVKKSFNYEEALLTVAKDYFLNLDSKIIDTKEFSNGRFVRNLFERTWAKAAMRREIENGKLRLTKEDFLLSVTDQDFKKDSNEGRKSKRMGFGSLIS